MFLQLSVSVFISTITSYVSRIIYFCTYYFFFYSRGFPFDHSLFHWKEEYVEISYFLNNLLRKSNKKHNNQGKRNHSLNRFSTHPLR